MAASTLGSLEALLVYLKKQKIPVSTVCIGDVTKNDLMKILTPFQQDDNPCEKTEYKTLLCFDVKLLPLAKSFAQMHDIKIIQAKIIYHLFDGFSEHVKKVKLEKKQKEGHLATFPCVLKIVQPIRNKKPIILGVDVIEGILREGTPICIPSKNKILLGKVENIQINKESIKTARRKDGSVAIRINTDNFCFGRHFTEEDELVSLLTRTSIDKLK